MTGNQTNLLSIALIGCGKMGSALLRGWALSGVASRIDVVEPHGPDSEGASPDTQGGATVYIHKSIKHLAAAGIRSDVAVLAVKPQVMDAACASLAPLIAPDTVILSIAAGRTIASFERHFGDIQPIIRTMPNTPAAIGRGITVAVANTHVDKDRRAMASSLLDAAGMVEWIDDEALLDAVTAVSGSGPAYVFLLIEAMAKAGERAGLPPALAMTLARETVTGSGALADSMPDKDAAALRREVTSPGGTTEAALKVLTRDDSFVTPAVPRGSGGNGKK